MSSGPVRPYVLLSCAASIDGYIDDATDQRLLLSNEDDFDRIDEVRAGCDAILVGAGTNRRDDPRLLIRSARRREERVATGRCATPVKVTITASGDLDPTARFFTAGETERLVFCASGALEKTRERIGRLATVLDGGEPLDLAAMLADLATRDVRRLMVEGGGSVHAQFLAAGLVDELQLVVAPFFVGDCRA
ncbi:RibD family protein, partial [Micromonospora azadirachtae]